MEAAREKATEVLNENFVTAPPVRVTEIASNYGLQVRIVDLADYQNRIAGFIDLEKHHIYVNKSDASTRQAFTVAHELGHWFLHRKELRSEPNKYAILYRTPLGDANVDMVERQANAFAAMLLVPKELLEKYRNESDNTTIADIFGVSPEVIGYRLKDEFGQQA